MNQSQPVLRAIVFLFLVVLSVQTAGAESKLYFPRISTSGINGLTIFNPGSGAAPSTAADDEVTLSLYGRDGDLVAGQGITNPAVLARIDHRFGNEGDFGRPERFSESFSIDPVQVE